MIVSFGSIVRFLLEASSLLGKRRGERERSDDSPREQSLQCRRESRFPRSWVAHVDIVTPNERQLHNCQRDNKKWNKVSISKNLKSQAFLKAYFKAYI